MAGPVLQDLNGVVTVTTVWADERLYYPVHAVPYTPAKHFTKGKNDPAFRTKLAIGAPAGRRLAREEPHHALERHGMVRQVNRAKAASVLAIHSPVPALGLAAVS